MEFVRDVEPPPKPVGLGAQPVAPARPTVRAARGPRSRGRDARASGPAARRAPRPRRMVAVAPRPVRAPRGRRCGCAASPRARGGSWPSAARTRRGIRIRSSTCGGDREVHDAQAADLPVEREDERTRVLPQRQPGIDDDRQARPAAGGHHDDVARHQVGQRLGGLARAVRPRPPAPSPSPWPTAPGGSPRTRRSRRGGRPSPPRSPAMRLLVALDLAGQADEPAVGLELGERRLQHLAGGRACRAGRRG